MLSDPVILIVGLALLLVPRGWLRAGAAHKKRTGRSTSGGPVKDRMPGDRSMWIEEEFRLRRNWIDFGRALCGGFAVMVLFPPIVDDLIAVPSISNNQVIFIAQALLLFAAVVIQMVRVEERLMLFPPIFFVLALAFPILGWKAGIMGFALIWAINLIIPNPALFLTVNGGIVIMLSVVFSVNLRAAGLLAALSCMPPLVAILSRRRLALFRKRTKIVV